MNKRLRLNLQVATKLYPFPKPALLRLWLKAILAQSLPVELTIRIADEVESAGLNQSYRQKSGSTNVLSFPYEGPLLQPPLLGDIVICAPLVMQEAQAQGKPIMAHWAHLVIHGVLHLLGYNHEQDAEAAVMEALEIKLLTQLGYPNPYLSI